MRFGKPAARHAARPGAEDDLVARSQRLLESVGFAFIPLLHAIGPWEKALTL